MTSMTGHNPILGGARRWDFLASLLGEGKAVFVELGAKEGRTTGHVLKSCPNVTVIAIDPWTPMPQMAEVPQGETYEKWDFEKIEADFWKNVGEHKDRVRFLRMTGEEAVLEVGADLDLVFIDAAHDYASVRKDIASWWPLVKPGGILAGHDWNHRWPSVERAVTDCFPLMQVGVGPDSTWFVLKHPGVQPRG